MRAGAYLVRETDNNYHINLDGKLLLSVRSGGTYLNVLAHSLSSNNGRVQGLLGSTDDDPANDFTTRDGVTLTNENVALSHQQLYHQFGNSWRISDAESLFEYEAGENTATFTDLSFPDKHLTLSDMDPVVRKEAEDICTPITGNNSIAFSQCVFDIGFTGDMSFLSGYEDLIEYPNDIELTLIEGAMNDVVPVDTIQATISAPKSAQIGQTISVEWTGPTQAGFIIEVISGTDPQADAQWLSRENVTESPLDLRMPGQPGPYIIRYTYRGTEGTEVLASTPITLESSSATLNAPRNADAGSTIEVEWTGPDQSRDVIDVVLISADGQERGRVAFHATKNGSPAILRLPNTPGLYRIRYILRSGDGDTVLVSRDIQVE